MRILMGFVLAVSVLFSGLGHAASATIDKELSERAAWQTKQALMRVLVEVSVQRPGQEPASWWGFWERSASDKYRFLQIDGPGGQPYSATYVQGATALVQIKGENHPLPATWMMGQFLVGQPIEPAAFFDWMFALPGPDFSIDRTPADVEVHEGVIESIQQSSWKIEYLQWHAATEHSPALPSRLRMTRDGTVLVVDIKGLETFGQLPADHTDFNIQ
jgi:outer membrane biogenesis lipoprotein LolB